MSAPEDDIDQDALAAEWGLELNDSAGQDDIAAQWAAMVDTNTSTPEQTASLGSVERVLNQDEIDSLLGFNLEDAGVADSKGIRAIINSALVSYERLPMLEIVFDRLVRVMTTSLRNFTSDNVEVSFDGLKSVRFGDYLNSIPLPAILAVFKAEEWDNFGVVTVESNLIYSVIDVLLGGRRGTQPIRIEGRPYTTIETTLVRRMIEIILLDMETAFAPLAPIHMPLERLETNPRFAAISRPANAAIIVQLRVDMEDRGGTVEIVLPYATIEPIRDLLLQNFMGEKFGRDAIWESHLATEVWNSEIEVTAVLHEKRMPLGKLRELKIGDTLMLDADPDEPIILKIGDAVLTEARMGKVADAIAVRIAKPFRRPKMTLQAFEKAGEMRRPVP